MRGYGNVLLAFSVFNEELVLLVYLGHSSYRVMVLYAFIGPRGPGVSIAARRAPLGEAWVVRHRLGEPSLVTSCPWGKFG